MTITELKQKLEEAYSLRNLNNVSLTLINLHKEQAFSKLQKIAEIISDFVKIEISDQGKGFSKLIMLYHPDRVEYYKKEISRLSENNDFDGMLELTHILRLEHIEEIAASLNSFEDIDYSPVYEWDMGTGGFTVYEEGEKITDLHQGQVNYNFYEAIKIRQYGNTDIEFPPYYLEDIDEFELSSSGINDLDGIQYCIHARSMDLSNNEIIDLSPLTGLPYLEELNLSGNNIVIIDDLCTLPNLKRIYLSDNSINDISCLMELVKLEYADLTGNKISQEQIDELIESGVTVEY